MPFDATTSTLALLGITPVPDHVVMQHKAALQREFQRQYPTRAHLGRWYEYYDSSKTAMITRAAILPRQLGFIASDEAEVTQLSPLNMNVADQVVEIFICRSSVPCTLLTLAPVIYGGMPGSIGGKLPPAAVHTIVDEAQRRAAAQGVETELVVGVFFGDPYVLLIFRENDETRHACLAIWDDETVLHRAKFA